MVLKPPEMINSLQTGQIDGFIAWQPYPAKSITSDAGYILADSGDIWPSHPCCVLVVDTKFLQSNPEIVLAVVKAHVKATALIKEKTDKAVKIAEKYTGMDLETINKAVKSVRYTYDLSIEGEKEYVFFLSELGYIKNVKPDDFIKDFLNTDILENALK
jgi:NitT/TauT family transport system substrate-binding protein